MRAEFTLHAHDILANLAAAIIDNRRLPIGVGFTQFLEQTAGETELGESSLELVVVLQFLALLGGHVGLEKDFAWVVRLRRELGGRANETKTGEKNQTDFFHALEKPRIVMCG